ncbi:hypothetical protein D3C85_1778340 [compost metagenome]
MILEIVGYVILVVVWGYVRIHDLIRRQKIKEATVYSGLMGMSAIVGCLLLAGVEIPSAIFPYRLIFEPLGKILLSQ